MTQHKWHKEIKAWADGAEIEVYDEVGKQWYLLAHSSPDWEVSNKYRIKPQPKEPQYLYVAYLDKEETWDFSLNKNLIECSPIHTYIGKIKLEVDDETN
jgi:hypothetical protein